MSTADTPPSTRPYSQSVPPSSSEKRPSYVLDTFAVFALIQKEKGETRVTELVAQARSDDASLHLSLINWGEVLYTIERERGEARLAKLKENIEKLPVVLAEVNRARVEAAAHIKSHYAVSYADAFAIGLAQELGATVVTGDPEFKAVEEVVSVLWL